MTTPDVTTTTASTTIINITTTPMSRKTPDVTMTTIIDEEKQFPTSDT